MQPCRRVERVFVVVVVGCGVGASCTASEPDQQSTAQALALGDPLPGTDPDEFTAAREAFAAVEAIEDGLGPTFNEAACGNCHAIPVIGGSGSQIERRFGRLDNDVFFAFDREPEHFGGTLRQLFTVGSYRNGDIECTIDLDSEPASATIHDVGRRTTPLFGLGLVDAMPDSWFDLIAALQPPSVRGEVVRVAPTIPDPRDPSQQLGLARVARFGLKGGVPNLVTFSADAYLNEMGISTQHCYRGTSIVAFANENMPRNEPAPDGCNGGDLAPPQPAGDPEVPEFTDDAVGSCADGRTEIQDDVVQFTFFMERLAPPPRAAIDPITFTRGAVRFAAVGCAHCHSALPFITPDQPFNDVPGHFVFFPFSDFLVHDMGALGDGIGATGDPAATTRRMRTAPLWGARLNSQFLHDGRASSIRDAILFHDGQGRAARDAFVALRARDQELLIAFVNAL